jgi:hypothetical protein
MEQGRVVEWSEAARWLSTQRKQWLAATQLLAALLFSNPLQVPSDNPDDNERDNKDEAICPCVSAEDMSHLNRW